MPSRCALLEIDAGGRCIVKLMTPFGVFAFAKARSSFTSAVTIIAPVAGNYKEAMRHSFVLNLQHACTLLRQRRVGRHVGITV
jgi:hypothetical protein